MRNTRVMLSAGIGLMVAVLGQGAEARASEQEVSVSEAGGDSRDMHLTAGPMSLAAFQQFALSPYSPRCVGSISVAEALMELDYGYSEGLISHEAYLWGRNNQYYPVIGRRNTVDAVCRAANAAAMSLATYQQIALGPYSPRCVGGVPAADAIAELQYGYFAGLISHEAYLWGHNNRYFPVIGRQNTVDAICRF